MGGRGLMGASLMDEGRREPDCEGRESGCGGEV